MEDSRAKRVEETVIYPRRQLPAPAKHFSFANDRARFKMVLRWMVFYEYVPGNATKFESQRTELRKRLGFTSSRLGQILGWFLNRQFRIFKDWGLVSQKKFGEPATYLEEAQRWLSSDWGGNIRYGETKRRVLSTSIMEKSREEHKESKLKRHAHDDLPSGKRQKASINYKEADPRPTDIVAHQSVNEQEGVMKNEASAAISSAHLRSSTATGFIEQQPTPESAAGEFLPDHFALGESATLVQTAAYTLSILEQDASSQGAPPVGPTAPRTDEETTPDQVTICRDGPGGEPDLNVALLASAKQAFIGSGAQLPSLSPYPAQPESAAAPSQEAGLVREQGNAVEEQALQRSSSSIPAEFHLASDIQKLHIAHDEATLLKYCYMLSLLQGGIRRGEYEQCNGLISEYVCGWCDSYIVNFRNSEMKDTAYIQAEEELSSPDSLLKSRQNFEEFLDRLRIASQAVVVMTQSQSTPLIPGLQIRRQYEEWCQNLDDYRKALYQDQTSRRVLENAISQIKVSINEVEVLASLAKNATEDQRQVIWHLREELEETKVKELQVLVSELQGLQEAIQEREGVIKNLERKKHQCVSYMKSMLGYLEAAVDYVRQLPVL